MIFCIKCYVYFTRKHVESNDILTIADIIILIRLCSFDRNKIRDVTSHIVIISYKTVHLTKGVKYKFPLC